MALDPRTLYALTTLICAVLGVAQLVVYIGQRNHRWILWWGSANLVVAAGLSLVALRGIISDFLSIPVGNALLTAGYATMWVGVSVFGGRKKPLAEAALVVLIVFLLLAVPSPISGELRYRIMVSAVTLGYLTIRVAMGSAVIGWREKMPVAWFVTLLFIAIALSHGLRFAIALHAAPGQDFMASTPAQIWMLMIAAVGATGSAMGLMLMATTRLQRSLARAAQLDTLTQVLNRNGFGAAAEPLLRDSGESRKNISLLLVDLDRFKTVNDQHGHAIGDRALQLFAKVAAQKLRPSDLVGRHGGDEFTILLPGTSLESALVIGERLRTSFREAALREFPDIKATISVGAASLDRQALSLEALLHEADVALYDAKRQGRDRVSAAPASQAASDGDQCGGDAATFRQ